MVDDSVSLANIPLGCLGSDTKILNDTIPFSLLVPYSLVAVLLRLCKAGHRVLVVGGALRDTLLGRVFSDYDLASSALPQQVQKLFRRTLPTGLKHGTVTIIEGGDAYQITSFRSDGIYKDGRHPESVEFGGDLLGDLARRDFTLNALAFEVDVAALDAALDAAAECKKISLPGQLHDPQNGIRHLQQRQICAIGVATERFAEDALRMLRACRFSARLGFAIEAETLKAIVQLHRNLARVSRERIQDEQRKLLCAPFPLYGLHYLRESRLWREVFPFLPLETGNGEEKEWFEIAFSPFSSALRGTLELGLRERPKSAENTKCLKASQTRVWLARLQEEAAKRGIKNSPYLRYDQVPLFSVAWALLHLCHFQLLATPKEEQASDWLEEAPEFSTLYNRLFVNDCEWPRLWVEFCAVFRRKSLLYRAAEQGLQYFSNREKSAALGLLERAPLFWGLNLFHNLFLDPQKTERSMRYFLWATGPQLCWPAVCLLAIHTVHSQKNKGEESIMETYWLRFCEQILDTLCQKPPLSLIDLAIDGRILSRDIPPGPQLGQILQNLLHHVLYRPEDNKRKTLLHIARTMYVQQCAG